MRQHSQAGPETVPPPSPRLRNGSACSTMAFRGTYEHSLDERGRVAIPARYREAFIAGGVLTPSPEGCLELYPVVEFENTAQRLIPEGAHSQRGRRLRRGFYARSWDVELDKQGRILVPPSLRDSAGLTGSVVLTGRWECIEIWATGRWQQEREAVEGEYAANLEAQGGGTA